MKNDKTESLRLRVSPQMRLKVVRYATKHDIPEAQVIRIALKNLTLLPTWVGKRGKRNETKGREATSDYFGRIARSLLKISRFS